MGLVTHVTIQMLRSQQISAHVQPIGWTIVLQLTLRRLLVVWKCYETMFHVSNCLGKRPPSLNNLCGYLIPHFIKGFHILRLNIKLLCDILMYPAPL